MVLCLYISLLNEFLFMPFENKNFKKNSIFGVYQQLFRYKFYVIVNKINHFSNKKRLE